MLRPRVRDDVDWGRWRIDGGDLGPRGKEVRSSWTWPVRK